MAIQVQHLNKNLEPPEFQELAGFMAERVWLDVMVVDAGLLQRVRVECLHIYFEHEAVTFVQSFQTDVGDISQHSMDVAWDDIMYAVKSELESPAEVRAIVEPPSNNEKLEDGFEAIKDAAIEAVCDVTAGNVMGLVKSLAAGGAQLRQDMVDRRHLVLWALLEMTDKPPDTLCYECGWRSPMPFQSARVKFVGKNADVKWAPVIRNVVKRAHEILGAQPTRTVGNSWKDICVT